MEPYKIIPQDYQCHNRWCERFSHWLNPFGNWNEPMPYPEKRRLQSKGQKMCGIPLSPFIWWNFRRNPFHNFNHYWIGIVPLGKRYHWYSPEQNGWTRVYHKKKQTQKYEYEFSWWKKPKRPLLPYFKWKRAGWEGYIGWMSRGSFGIAFRKD